MTAKPFDLGESVTVVEFTKVPRSTSCEKLSRAYSAAHFDKYEYTASSQKKQKKQKNAQRGWVFRYAVTSINRLSTDLDFRGFNR